jgi:hypothetical protein
MVLELDPALLPVFCQRGHNGAVILLPVRVEVWAARCRSQNALADGGELFQLGGLENLPSAIRNHTFGGDFSWAVATDATPSNIASVAARDMLGVAP